MNSSWGSSSWGGTFQNLSMRIFSEDFSDELGGSSITPPTKASSSFSIASAASPVPQKEYTSQELQEHMKCLMTSQPELWKKYKAELSKEENPTHPETVRRVLIAFLNRQESLKEPRKTTLAGKGNIASQWKPGVSPARRRRPRQSAASMVNSLKDSLHRSLHAEEMQILTQQQSSNASPRKLPPRRASMPLREKFRRKGALDASEHSTSSASFHDDDDDAGLPVLQTDKTQQKLMRLQQIPHLWMMYQSERLEEQTRGMENETKPANDKEDGVNDTSRTTQFIPTADQSSLESFWNVHEKDIFEFEKEEAEARLAAAEEAKRRKEASKVHIELNTSFHLETSTARPPRNLSGHSKSNGIQTKSEHSIFSIGSLGSASKMQQDPVQKKLTRVQKIPDLEFEFQKLLGTKETPNDAKTIQETIEEFWAAHEKDVIEFERRFSMMYVDLNTSLHEEALPTVYRPSQERMTKGSSSNDAKKVTIGADCAGIKDKRATFAAQRESFSTRSFRSFQLAVNDLTGELDNSATSESRRGSDAGNNQKVEGRRGISMQMYKKQGEGLSIRSMRSVRMAIDDLAGEMGDEKATTLQPSHNAIDANDSSIREGMMSFFSGTASRTSATASGSTVTPSPNTGLFGRLSTLLTQDLESEVTGHESRTPLTAQTTPPALSSSFGFDRACQNDIIDDEDDDEFFQEAAQIAASMSMRRREQAPSEESKSNDTDNQGEDANDPMMRILRDHMLEVTMHNEDEQKDENAEAQVVSKANQNEPS